MISYVLRIFFNHPSIDNCHLDSRTTLENQDKSKHLAALLSMCLSNNVLSPFIDNPKFDDKCIEMLQHLMDMKHPISKLSASTIYNSLSNQTIASDESFGAFAKCLRLMYKTCTRSGIPYDEGYLICCFIQGLDSNFDYSHKLLERGVLLWYELSLNEVLILVNDIKLNKQPTGSWITTSGKANATGKQGAKRPSSSSSDPSNDHTTPVDPSLQNYLSKQKDLTQKEVKQLLERYSCPLCRKNTHPLYNCYALKTTYNISLKSQSASSNHTSTSVPDSTAVPPSATANRVASDTPFTITDEPQRYNGFECIQAPPPDSSSETSIHENDKNTTQISESLSISKINNSTTSYLKSYQSLKHCMGSVRQCTVTIPKYATCNNVSFQHAHDYPIIIDCGATHHKWNDSKAFINFMPMH